jgi:hypothetical protein
VEASASAAPQSHVEASTDAAPQSHVEARTATVATPLFHVGPCPSADASQRITSKSAPTPTPAGGPT